jgi:hypothetical protein
MKYGLLNFVCPSPKELSMVYKVYNPSLREEPRERPASVIPTKQNASILDWLESAGRLLARQAGDFEYVDDEEEINDLMGNDDAVAAPADDFEDDEDLGDLED